MKRILVHRNQVVAMASRKQWKKYWGKLSLLVFKNIYVKYQEFIVG